MDKACESGTKRIQGYDLARGIAIFAMVIIDFKSFFCVDETFPQWLYALIEYMDRRAAVILVMLAGAGMTLMLRRAGLSKSRDTLLKRAVFLILCGILLTRIWPADILHFYGFFILTGLALAHLSNRWLLAGAALFWLACFPVLFDGVCQYLESLDPGTFAGRTADLFFTGYYPVFPWAGLYVLGMWLGRQDLNRRRVTLPLLITGMLTALLSECSGYIIPEMALKTILSHGACDETAAHMFILLSKLTGTNIAMPSPAAVLSGAGTGMCVIMLSFLCSKARKQGARQYFLILGKNTLSLYVLHILFIKGVENLPDMGEDYPVLWVTAAAILFSTAFTLFMRLWLQKFTMGPLESAMRYFPYVRIPRAVKGHPGANAR